MMGFYHSKIVHNLQYYWGCHIIGIRVKYSLAQREGRQAAERSNYFLCQTNYINIYNLPIFEDNSSKKTDDTELEGHTLPTLSLKSGADLALTHPTSDIILHYLITCIISRLLILFLSSPP